MDEDMIELDENEDTGIIKVDENEDIDVIELDENEDIGNVALKNLLKGDKGDAGAPGESGVSDYEKLENLPKINGHDIIGNLTTEDLEIGIPNESEIFDASCTISLATMTVTNVSNFSKDIIAKRNEGYLIRMNCNFVENPKMNVVVVLNVIDGNWTFFYPVIRGNIGQGMKNYIFRLGIGEDNATIEAYDLSGGSAINLLYTFDIEEEVGEEDVYSAIAILELMDIFGFEIYQIQEFIADHENRISALENQ